MKYERIVILTGAGISAESGLKTFRDNGGLWEDHRVEEVATPEAFARDPAMVHRFYNARRRQLQEPGLGPNAAHLALARLEQAWPGELLLVTQNVDNLHERAGCSKLIHMHGELLKARCTHCDAVLDWLDDLSVDVPCPACSSPGALRPNVVWFGEMPLEMDRIYQALADCDVFAGIGTSGQVYPAAGFVQQACQAGAYTIELNREATGGGFAEQRQGEATRLVPDWVDELLAFHGL